MSEQRFEYKSERVLRRKVERTLNKLAAKVWELVDRRAQLNAYDVLTLRRPK